MVETVVSELRVDLKPATEASKGTYCSVPIDFSPDTDRLKDDITPSEKTSDGSSEGPSESKTPVRKLRRGDRIYVWE